MPYCNEFHSNVQFYKLFLVFRTKEREQLTLQFSDYNLSEHHPAVESISEKELK